MAQQEEYAKKIVIGIRELDFAKERYRQIQNDTQTARQQIIDSKLKPKGDKLLNRKK